MATKHQGEQTETPSPPAERVRAERPRRDLAWWLSLGDLRSPPEEPVHAWALA